jgi:RNA polymerase sigma-70 factor (ECF subfamily)
MRPFHVLPDESTELVTAAVDGDEAAFDALARHHRDALHAHCRRVLGRSADVDDAVQETLLRAWRRLGTFEHRCSFGWWLRCIATRVCIDIAHRSARTPLLGRHQADRCEVHRSRADPPPADAGADPAAVLAARAAVEHAYLLALRTLPERQCAVLVLRLVLRFSAAETAALVGCTVAAVNSALQRANAGLAAARASSSPAEHPPPATAAERQLVRRLVAAHARGDAGAVVATLLGEPQVSVIMSAQAA